MKKSRRAVFVCCDGLGRDWVRRETTPVLHDLGRNSLWCDAHTAVFPSVTRVSAASVSTGCLPGRHGLHGNRMGLLERGRIVVRDVGHPDFRTHMRRATGRTLLVPSLAERVAGVGGFIAFSNVSPGAAYFLDPDHFGYVYHRAGSYAPNGEPIASADALDVSHDLAGDWAMTQRFCAEVLGDRRPTAAILWLANPDLTLHGVPLGSPEHHDALGQTERCVLEVFRTIEGLRDGGEEILLLVGSDHGQETIGACIDLSVWLVAHGLGGELEAGEVAVAGQGTAALLYATDRGRGRLLGVLDEMRSAPWADEIVVEGDLARRGHAARGGVVAAVNMARQDNTNAYGIRGRRYVAAEPDKPAAIGSGQHGGWGTDETRPFLIANDGRSSGTAGRPTSLVDIAPTIVRFLGLPVEGFDGAPLPLD
ncbi:alkaline phosphatase family protein [Reyranella sp.]|uniref:alkaline phosphatase family protein n=1 Tax=Reyranella sp. TaxID=1929291 RepID=UPI002F957B98